MDCPFIPSCLQSLISGRPAVGNTRWGKCAILYFWPRGGGGVRLKKSNTDSLYWTAVVLSAVRNQLVLKSLYLFSNLKFFHHHHPHRRFNCNTHCSGFHTEGVWGPKSPLSPLQSTLMVYSH